MGTQDVRAGMNGEQHRLFMKRLLGDIRAFEQMLETPDLVETGVSRIGAEQELFLVDRAWRPAPRAAEILALLDDPRITTELARFNLEFNLDPLSLDANCLSRMAEQLDQGLARIRDAARQVDGTQVVLTGILPTIVQTDLAPENMTDLPRYRELNEALNRLRGQQTYKLEIKGTDELTFNHNSVMPEACNTSFQVHFQVDPDNFAKFYNIAQASIGPVLAAATNSPLLLGQRLWRETRIAVFQQALETRSTAHHERLARVGFGRSWVKRSVLEIFKEDISRFRVLVGSDADEDPFAVLAEGRPPEFKALTLHLSTVYRWNRACYGISDGRAQLRIENRVLPAGPTVVDEVANAAFWFGLMRGLWLEYDDITSVMDFDHAKANFVAAAHHGLDAHLTWTNGRSVAARSLICDELLPLARNALVDRGLDKGDVDHYLGVIAQRVTTGRTGSQWLLDSLAGMKGQGTRFQRLSALTAATAQRQREGQPVHHWPLATLPEAGEFKEHYQRVEQLMTTDLFTVHKDDHVDLAAAVMDWQQVRYVLVEDDDHRLVGLVTVRMLLQRMMENGHGSSGEPTPVSSLMVHQPISVTPDTATLEAIRLMREHRIGCLPVVKEGLLVGLLTDRSFVHLADDLLSRRFES